MAKRSPAAPSAAPEIKPAAQQLVEAESPHIAPLLVLFAASGCAALIYEIVWFQLLELVIGSSGISLGLLLAAYMGGLCAGSALLARVVSARHPPLRVYA